MNPEYKAVFIFPKDIENDIIKSIQFFDLEAAKIYVHEFLKKIANAKLPHNDVQIMIVWLTIDIIKMLLESGEHFISKVGDNRSLVEQVFTLKSIQEIESWFIDCVVKQVINMLDLSNSENQKKISGDAIKIIQEKYDTDLTLEDCASELKYHPNHLGKVFRKEMDMSFSEYLGSFRIEIAKKWLRGSNMKISDIAEKLRYTHSQNFTRSFKRMVGVSPSEYKEKRNNIL